MHDLVHDLARSVMADELLVSDAKKGSNSSRNKYCRCAFLTKYNETTKLSTIFPAKVRALRFFDCQIRNDAFSLPEYLRVLDLRGCPFSKLPKCVSQLSRLRYLNLRGSDQISALPESIGKIERLMHLDLKGCSRLVELPKAFSSLTKLQYLNFSRCSNLEKLPEDIGSLTKLQYLKLSDCRKIGELPQSFRKLHNLVHLDLSRCCGMKGIPGALGGLTKLQYLNISKFNDPSIGQDWCHLRGLSDVLGSLTELHYLNLSSSLGPIFRFLPSNESSLGNLIEHLDLSRNIGLNYLPESLGNLKRLHTLDISHCYGLEFLPEGLGNLERLHTLDISYCYGLESLPESLGNLERLHTLDISHNSGLDSIPESLGNLKRLHTLDISHCNGLDSIPESIGAIRTLKFIKVRGCSNQLKVHMTHSPLLSKFVQFVQLACFMVHANDVNTFGNLHLLEDVNHAELEICSLENVRFLEEARRVKLFEKQNLSKLTFDWALDACRLLEDKDVLEELVPPRGLKHLRLRGYSSIDLPTWLMGINLVKIKLEKVPKCNNLPPLGQLPNLKGLHLIGLCSITKIGEDLCGGGGAFSRLSTFTLKNMEQLEEWSTTYCGEDGVEEFMFPKLKTLETWDCPSLRLKPCPPIFSYWCICRSDKVISSWGEGGHISISSSTPATRLMVACSKVTMDKWRLLHHIPTLQELELSSCNYLASLPESMRHLVSLRSLKLKYCSSISVLPEWMGQGHVTSLESLIIDRCRSIKSLPHCVQQLTKLNKLEITWSYELRKWCESEENKIKLAHIKKISYDPPMIFDLPEDNSVSLQLFMVSDVNTCSKLHQLEDVNLKELKISCLENVRSLEEARKIKLLERQSLSKLTLEWTSDEDRFLEDKDVLGELVPPRGLQHLELDGYSCLSFPTWLMGISHYLPNLAKIKLENLLQCSNLSPLGQLPNLHKLHLKRLQSMTKIDRDFCGGEGAFLRMSEFALYNMEQLEEWNTTYCGEDGVEKFMFPKLDKLNIKDCPKLRLTPRPPIFRIWTIHNSDMVISSWSEGDHISHSPSDTPGTMLWVSSSKVPVGEWRLLHHLPNLIEIKLENLPRCSDLSPLGQYVPNLIEIMLENLPRCSDLSPLGQLPNLDKLHLRRLQSMTKIDRDFCGGEGAFLRLSEFTLYNMEQLEEWNTTYCGEDGVEKFMFPKLDKLDIKDCPKLRLTPRPPIFRIWTIHNSDMVISSWSEGDHISHSPSDTPGTMLWVSSSKVPVGEWRLLHHLPNLIKIKLENLPRCNDLSPLGQYLPNLIEIKLENLPRCSDLPPLEQLPNLDKLHLRRLQSMTKIDRDFCGGEGAFLRLSEFTLYNMEQLEEWNTTYCGEDGVEKFMFPKLDKLDIKDCPKLRLTPRPPIFRIWTIHNSDMVISSWSEGDHISHSPSDTPGTMLWVSSSKVPVGEWRLLHHLPNLIEIKLENLPRCSDLSPLGQYLPNLIEIMLENLPRCSDLPPLGQLPNLDKLHLRRLQSMTKIDRDFCGGEGAFLRLSEFTLYNMEQLEEWNTTYCGEDGVEKFMFPKLDKLDIKDCPKLRLTPRPPIFRIWTIHNSDMVISSWSEGDHISHSPSDTPDTMLWVSSSKVPVGEWRLLHHLPNLIEIKLENLPRCSDLSPLGQYLPNLIEIKLENLPRCNDLPPLGQLPNLDKLHLRRLQSMTKIDRDFCGEEGPFLRLSEFTLHNMEQLEEWNTTYCGEDGVEKFMFPKLDKLDIKDCPKLRLTPRPPIFRIWKIWKSDMVISSWSEGDHISHSPSDTPGTTLEVSSSKVPVGEWRLLHHLPTLQVLVIKYCDKLTSLPDNTQHLASLQSLELDGCDGILALPEWLGHLTSLERLIVIRCRSIKSLPHCIQQLTKLKELRIWSNPELRKWCESDENKIKLAHIENISLWYALKHVIGDMAQQTTKARH